MTGVYVITNEVPGYENTYYIGSSIDIPRRFKQHMRVPKKMNGTRKNWDNFRFSYGTDTLNVYVLHECDESELDALEITTTVWWRHYVGRTWNSPFSTRRPGRWW